MADASTETIKCLIENSEKGLEQIELSLPLILEARQTICKLKGENKILDLMNIVFDILLAENEVTYDLSASLNSLLRAKDDYTKRFFMQILNLCFCEACQLFVGENGDEESLLSQLVKRTNQLNLTGCEIITKHIIDDIHDFENVYAYHELRNITRHYDSPIKMYDKQHELDNVDYYAKGVSQLLSIRTELSVLSSYLLALLTPIDEKYRSFIKDKRCTFDVKRQLNDAVFNAFNERELKDEVQRILEKGQVSLDKCYAIYKNIKKTERFLEKQNLHIPEEFEKMESLTLMRMETLFLRYDVACSIWGYLNSVSDKERSQNLRLIHITKQAALTHIYGYNEKARERSLWTKIKNMEESGNESLNTLSIEASLGKLTGNLSEDNNYSQIFAHYRHNHNYYIPERLEILNKMDHYKELIDAMNLLKVCNTLEGYTASLLSIVEQNQRLERKSQHEKWNRMIDDLVAKAGNDERIKEALKPFRNLIEIIYRD